MFGDKVEEFITWSCTSQYQAKYDYWPFNHPTFPKILNSKIPINVYLSIVSLGASKENIAFQTIEAKYEPISRWWKMIQWVYLSKSTRDTSPESLSSMANLIPLVHTKFLFALRGEAVVFNLSLFFRDPLEQFPSFAVFGNWLSSKGIRSKKWF